MAENKKTEQEQEITLFDQIDGIAIQNKLGRLYPVIFNIQTKDKTNQYFIINKMETTIGRSPGCDIQLDSSRVSRSHAIIYYENFHQPEQSPKCVIVDSESRNGTFLNGKKIEKPTGLHRGDSIVIGDKVISFDLRTKKELNTKQSFISSIRNHESPPKQTPTLAAQLRMIIPKETFSPRNIMGQVQIINPREAHFKTDQIDRALFQVLLQQEVYIRCVIDFKDQPEPVPFYGKLSWVHFDNKLTPPVCVIGIEFSKVTEEQQKILTSYLED